MRRCLAALPALALSAPVRAADLANGQRLVQAHCQHCHDARIYQRPGRKVKDLEGLAKQVRWCVKSLDLTWFDEEVADVVDYLNDAYYHFRR